jgi:hypothetical protein
MQNITTRDAGESFANMQAFNNALQKQKPCSVMEMTNGTGMLVLYEPVHFILLLGLF